MNIQDQLGKVVNEYYSDQKKGNTDILIALFKKMVVVRNEFAREKGFRNYFEMQIYGQNIPATKWKEYLENRDLFAKKYSPKINKVSEYPHFLSKIEKINLTFPDDVFLLFKDIIPDLADIKKRVELLIEGKQASFKYDVQADRYKIVIPNTNHNQKIAMLIHELSHVYDQERKDHKIKGVYESENGAHQVEFEVAGSISKEFLIADVREYLSCLARTEFEESIYSKNDQNYPELYASIINKYFGEVVGGKSYLFLNDDKVIQKPLSDLSVAVVLVNLLPELGE